MNYKPALRRVARREMHSPRTVAMITASTLAIALLVYVGTEIVLAMLLQPAAFVSPGDARSWLLGFPDMQPSALVVLVASLVALTGGALCLLAILPGRLAKHRFLSAGRVVLVDNAVMAVALAQALSDQSGIARDRIAVGVSRRVVDVTVQPDAGVPLSDSQTREVLGAELEKYQLAKSVTTRIRSARQSKGERA